MSKKKNGEKNPYRYSATDLRIAEQGFWIQIGTEVYISDGIIVFPPEIIEQVSKAVLKELRNILDNGADEEKDSAMLALASFYIHPLRVH